MGGLQSVTDAECEDSVSVSGWQSREYVNGGVAEVDEFGRSLELLKWKPLDIDRLTPGVRDACRELFRRGDISWLLHPEQRKLLSWMEDHRREISVICMSRQWGKTFMLLAYAITHCLTHDRETVLFLAPHLQQLQTILMPRINQMFQFLPSDLIPERRLGNWMFTNGSVLRLDGCSVQKGVRIRGDAVHLCIIDECRDIIPLEEVVSAHVTPMFTTTNGKLVLISSPPDSPAHVFSSKYIPEAIGRDDFYQATFRENPLLTTSRLRYLTQVLYPGGMENPTFRREYLADYTIADVEKLVVREWDEDSNDDFFAKYPGPRNLVRPYIGMDYAHSDPCGIIAGYFDPMVGALIVTAEHFERHLNTQEVGLIILGMEKKLLSALPTGCPEPIRIMDIDPALMGDLNAMFGIRFEPAFKSNSTLAMNNRLRVAFVEQKVRISPSCVNLRYQLKTGVFTDKGKDYLRTEKTGHLDLISALRYTILNLRWTELLNPEMPAGGLMHNQMNISPFRTPHGTTFRHGIINRPI